MTRSAGTCAKCGLRVVITTTGWHHLSTVAGQEAERDHQARVARARAKGER